MSLCTIPLVRWIHITVLHAVSEGFTPSASAWVSRRSRRLYPAPKGSIPAGRLSTAGRLTNERYA